MDTEFKEARIHKQSDSDYPFPNDKEFNQMLINKIFVKEMYEGVCYCLDQALREALASPKGPARFIDSLIKIAATVLTTALKMPTEPGYDPTEYTRNAIEGAKETFGLYLEGMINIPLPSDDQIRRMKEEIKREGELSGETVQIIRKEMGLDNLDTNPDIPA
jgi:hypothetical protein